MVRRASLPINATPSGAAATVPVTVVDAGLYVQDDWKVRPNFTLSGGLRFETQNAIHDHADWAPRLGFAWGIGGGGKSAPKTVLRGGFGLFYDRFTQDLVLNADRLNGVTQQQYIVTPHPPIRCLSDPAVPCSTLPPDDTGDLPDRSESARALHHADRVQPGAAGHKDRQCYGYVSECARRAPVSVAERQRPDAGHAGLVGTASKSERGPIYQYSSDGVFRQNQLIANFNIRAGAKLSLFGYYSLNYANSDTSGASSFPSNQYDVGADYGRASFDIRHRVFMGGTIGLPHGFRLSPFMIFNSGSPYNVTVGQDLEQRFAI